MHLLWLYLALLSAFFFGIKDIFAKKLFKQGQNPDFLIFEEYLLILVLVLFLFFPKVNFAHFGTFWWLFLLKGLFLLLGDFFYFYLLRKYPISIASPVMNLTPIMLIFLSYFILHERLTFLHILGIFLTIICAYFFEVTFHHSYSQIPSKKHFSVLGNFIYDKKFFFSVFMLISCFSVTAIFDKLIFIEGISVYTNLYFTSFVISILIFYHFLRKGLIFPFFRDVLQKPKLLFPVGLSILSQYLVLLALQIPSAMVSLVVPVRRISTIISSIFGGFVFKERHLALKFIYICGMLFGVFLMII